MYCCVASRPSVACINLPPSEGTEIIYGLDDELNLSFFNRSYVDFARENSSPFRYEKALELGRSIYETIGGPIRDFYVRNFLHVLRTGQEWLHRYECSSPTVYRLFQMATRRLGAGQGLITVHYLIQEAPHSVRATRPRPENYAHYVREHGMIVQCSHCRRVRASEVRWDWIPEWLQKPPAIVSHGLCPACLPVFSIGTAMT